MSTMYPSAILNTNTKINPAAPESAEYFGKNQVAYVIKINGKLRVATSYSLLSYFPLGSRREFCADQSRRNLGFGTIVGIASFATGSSVGNVPSKKLAHWVFK